MVHHLSTSSLVCYVNDRSSTQTPTQKFLKVMCLDCKFLYVSIYYDPCTRSGGSYYLTHFILIHYFFYKRSFVKDSTEMAALVNMIFFRTVDVPDLHCASFLFYIIYATTLWYLVGNIRYGLVTCPGCTSPLLQ